MFGKNCTKQLCNYKILLAMHHGNISLQNVLHVLNSYYSKGKLQIPSGSPLLSVLVSLPLSALSLKLQCLHA